MTVNVVARQTVLCFYTSCYPSCISELDLSSTFQQTGVYISLLLFIHVKFHDETTTLLNVNSPLTGDGKYMLLSDDVFNVSVRMFPRRFLGGLTKSFR